jgi:hypothetical protein
MHPRRRVVADVTRKSKDNRSNEEFKNAVCAKQRKEINRSTLEKTPEVEGQTTRPGHVSYLCVPRWWWKPKAEMRASHKTARLYPRQIAGINTIHKVSVICLQDQQACSSSMVREGCGGPEGVAQLDLMTCDFAEAVACPRLHSYVGDLRSCDHFQRHSGRVQQQRNVRRLHQMHRVL